MANQEIINQDRLDIAASGARTTDEQMMDIEFKFDLPKKYYKIKPRKEFELLPPFLGKIIGDHIVVGSKKKKRKEN